MKSRLCRDFVFSDPSALYNKRYMADPNTPPETGWQYKPDDKDSAVSLPAQSLQNISSPSQPSHHDQEVSWTASEFIAHHKSPVWYFGLALCGSVLAALVYLITRDKITLAIILFCFLVFGIVAGRQPRILAYHLDVSGLSVGERHYPYETFKAFALVDEGTFTSLVFLPLKRFGTTLTVYFDPEDEDHILDVLSEYLPLEQGKLDLFESLMHRVRF